MATPGEGGRGGGGASGDPCIEASQAGNNDVERNLGGDALSLVRRTKGEELLHTGQGKAAM